MGTNRERRVISLHVPGVGQVQDVTAYLPSECDVIPWHVPSAFPEQIIDRVTLETVLGAGPRETVPVRSGRVPATGPAGLDAVRGCRGDEHRRRE